MASVPHARRRPGGWFAKGFVIPHPPIDRDTVTFPGNPKEFYTIWEDDVCRVTANVCAHSDTLRTYELKVTLDSEVWPFGRVAARSLGMTQRSPHEADVVSEPHPVGAITGLCRYVGRISVKNGITNPSGPSPPLYQVDNLDAPRSSGS